MTGWIACSDRLPGMVEDYGRFSREYLICTDSGTRVARMRIADGRLDCWVDDDDDLSWSPEVVTHWRPLPPPPDDARPPVTGNADRGRAADAVRNLLMADGLTDTALDLIALGGGLDGRTLAELRSIRDRLEARKSEAAERAWEAVMGAGRPPG